MSFNLHHNKEAISSYLRWHCGPIRTHRLMPSPPALQKTYAGTHKRGVAFQSTGIEGESHQTSMSIQYYDHNSSQYDDLFVRRQNTRAPLLTGMLASPRPISHWLPANTMFRAEQYGHVMLIESAWHSDYWWLLFFLHGLNSRNLRPSTNINLIHKFYILLSSI